MAPPSDSVADLVEDDQNTKKIEFKHLSVRQKIKYVKEAITIEPILCCYLISLVLCLPALNNLQLEMACRANAGFNETVCEAVVTATHAEHNFTDQNSIVQQYISDMLSWCIPVQSVVPVILLLFVGTYSDRHGIRKPFLLLPVLGEFLGTIGSICCKIFMQTWPVAAVGATQFIVSSFFGGPAMITMAAFAYIADITTPEERTMRVAMTQMCLSICIPIALTFSGIIFDAIGYIASLAIGLLLYAFAFIYGVLLVKEPKQQKNMDLKELLIDIVNPRHAIDTLKLLTKMKADERNDIIFIIVIVYIISTVVGGEDYVFFYFTQHAYGWNYTDYTYFLAMSSVITSGGLAIGVLILTKIFHLDDLIIIVLSFIDNIATNIVSIIVKSSLGLYIGMCIAVLQEVGSVGIRSLSTKYAAEEDTGKIQSLIAITEAIAVAVAAQIYHQGIYTYTRDTYIQTFLYFGVILYGLGIVIVMWQYFKQKRKPSNGPSDEQDTEMKQSAPE